MKYRLFIIAAFVVISGSTFACKCKDPGTAREAFGKTPFIIHGKVVRYTLVSLLETVSARTAKAIQELRDSSVLRLSASRMVAKVEVEIMERFKGSYRKKTVIIYSMESSASCGYPFEEGKSYVIYASPDSNAYAGILTGSKRKGKTGKKNTFWTNQCTRTTADVDAEIAQLKSVR